MCRRISRFFPRDLPRKSNLETGLSLFSWAARCSANGTGQSSRRSLRRRSRGIFTALPNGRNSIRLWKGGHSTIYLKREASRRHPLSTSWLIATGVTQQTSPSRISLGVRGRSRPGMRACRFHQRMVVQLGCSCRISIFGKVPNGSGESVLWERISPASGSLLATTIMATPGKSSDMTATETAAQPVRRLEWQLAQVREIVVETYRVKSLLLHVANWRGHLSGQHLDIRLTAEDGYQAQRSYSIASPPEDELLTLTVERVDNGEVSPYLVDDLHVGDQ